MNLKPLSFLIVLSLFFTSNSFAETRYCESPSFFNEETQQQEESLDENILSRIGRIEVTDTLTPITNVLITAKNGELIYEGEASKSYFEYLNLDENILSIGAHILGFDSRRILGYQVDILQDGGEDGTGFAMFQFNSKNGEHLGTLLNLGWGFATCQQEGKSN